MEQHMGGSGDRTVQEGRQAATKRETDRDMRGVRPPDGLMTTGNITAGSRTPTVMIAVA